MLKPSVLCAATISYDLEDRRSAHESNVLAYSPRNASVNQLKEIGNADFQRLRDAFEYPGRWIFLAPLDLTERLVCAASALIVRDRSRRSRQMTTPIISCGSRICLLSFLADIC